MRKTIKLITLVITMLLLSTIALADSNIIVKINNNQVNFNRLHNNQSVGEPFIENSRTYLPIRVISEDLGYKVDWKEESKTAIITKGKTTVEITIGKSTALVNGVKKPIDVDEKGNARDTKAVMRGGRTYVPVRFIAEAMGDKVEYRHPSTSNVKKPTVYINCTDLPEEKPVVKPEPSGLVPEFYITPKSQSGAMDFRIYVSNFQKYKGTGATFSPALVSHPQYNSYKVIDPVDGQWNVVNDANTLHANYAPDYSQNIFNLRDWSVNGKRIDLATGKNQVPPKVGELIKWRVTIKMNTGTEVYEFDVPYKNFNAPIITSGTRVK